MIDKKWIGHAFPPLTAKVESGQLAFFAKAVSENNPVYKDENDAIVQGYERIPAPLTFGFSLNLNTPETFGYLKDMGVPIGRILHGEQKFKYYKPILEGDEITLQRSIMDIATKKEGKMELIFEEVTMNNQNKELVGKMNIIIVVRN
tara:strand:+ start:514 stop:954 length:441 start_codon:yes stop_codon:yes gene_type:complete